MNSDFFGAGVAFAFGVVVASANYFFSKHMLKKHPDMYASTHIVRQFLQVGYLVLILCFGDMTPWDKIWLLVGGTLGVTLPMFWFTMKLVKMNDSSDGKGDKPNG